MFDGKKFPVTGIMWDGPNEVEGSDIHVLRNNIPSQPLITILKINRKNELTDKEEKSSNATSLLKDEGLEFFGNFNHNTKSHGITFDQKTGIITADSTGRNLHNFIIHAIVTDSSVVPPVTFETKIRAQIHDNLVKVWLTPSPLTIRQGTKGHRMTLLAKFSDDTFGMIPSNSAVKWKSNCKFAVIDELTGKITVDKIPNGPLEPAEELHVEDGVHIATITVILPPALMGGTATGKIKLAKPWKSLGTKATPIENHPRKSSTAEATLDGIKEKYNILILPEGFTEKQKGTFFKLVRTLVNKLRNSPSLYPLNLLSDNFNYWCAFVESHDKEGGVSLLNEMITWKRSDGRLWGNGSDIPYAIGPDRITRPNPCGPPPAAKQIWPLSRLVFEAGMPIPADRTVNFTNKKDHWASAYGNHIADHVDLPRYEGTMGSKDPKERELGWQHFSRRRIANEKDTTFGLAYGSYPHASYFSPQRQIDFHPYRTTREEFDEFLSQITFRIENQDIPLGEVWTKDKDGEGGKSYPMIFFLCGGSPSGGTVSQVTAFSIEETQFVILEEVDNDNTQLKLIPYPPSTTLSTDLFSTFAHEFAHNFFLDDEYGELPCVPANKEKSFESWTSNIQIKSSLLRTQGGLDPDKIHWLWHRIKKAGLTQDKLIPQPGSDPMEFKFPIWQDTDTFKVGNKIRNSFEVGDIVRLRHYHIFVANKHLVSKKLKIINITGDRNRKEVTAKLMEPDSDPKTNYPIWFPPASTIFIPAHGPDGSELFLVTPAILEHMRKTHGPLNAPKNNEMRPCDPYAKPEPEQVYPSIQVATSLPDDDKLPRKNRPRYRSWYVGIYEGGGQYDCDVYHPTGACLMKSQIVINKEGIPITKDERGRSISIYNFCPVCKYILVDFLDQTKHGIIDKRYEKRYPI